MSILHRRGACPGLSAPMPTGDGLLVRLMPVAAVAPERFAAFCAAAARHGNGTIEITARGSLQVRGLTPQSAPVFAENVAALAIAVDGLSVLTNPLAGEAATEFDEAAFAAALREMVAGSGIVLAPKVSVVVDNGERLHLDALKADLRLCAISMQAGAKVHIAVAGDAATAVSLGAIDPENAAGVALALLKAIAARGAVRASEILASEDMKVFHDAVASKLVASELPARPPAEPVGFHPARDGKTTVGIALAFGHAHANALSELAAVASAAGAVGLRPAPGRALLIVGLPNDDAVRVAAAVKRLGFIVRADDPRQRIVACPGAPACASGLIPARQLAGQLVGRLPELPRRAVVHISGCSKGCAHPATAAVTLVGTDRGCGLVRNGTARAVPERMIESASVTEIVANISGATREAGYG